MKFKAIKDYLSNHKIDTTNPSPFLYDINRKKVSLTLDQMLEGAKRRVGSETEILSVLCKIETQVKKNSWQPKDLTVEDSVSQSLLSYLKDMGANEAFVGQLESNWPSLVKDYGMDKKFLQWWAKEKGLSDQQMFCDHDMTDMHTSDGGWYNSTGTCIKCLIEDENTLESNEEIDLVYKAWKNK
jgi:hypothetical protein